MGLFSGGIIGDVVGGLIGTVGGVLGLGGGGSYSAGAMPVLDMNSPEYQRKLRETEIKAIQSMLGSSTQSTVDLLKYTGAQQSNKLVAIQELRNSTYETIR